MWFESLVGFPEVNGDQVRANLIVADGTITSLASGRRMACGSLTTPSLAEIRRELSRINFPRGSLKIAEIVGDVQSLHATPKNAGAMFQAASQFNLLEMVHPSVTPEQGIDGYENDRTQGPACAIACGAGTIYRNYFVPVEGCVGQSEHCQIDCLKDLGALLGNAEQQLWKMQNGYALATSEGLTAISKQLAEATEQDRDRLRGKLRIGLQEDADVTINDAKHKVSQAYCSALPVAYSNCDEASWKSFAQLVLEAAYEATLGASILNAARTGNSKVFLTLLGGGVFGNRIEWIIAAIARGLSLFADYDLEVSVVSFGQSNSYVRQLADNFPKWP